jgi:5'-nucleotidase
VDYLDFIAVARDLAAELRGRGGAQLVVALTHMREPNDIRLAAEVEGIDLVLG